MPHNKVVNLVVRLISGKDNDIVAPNSSHFADPMSLTTQQAKGRGKPKRAVASSPTKLQTNGASEIGAPGALGKAFTVLEIVSQHRQPITMAEIVRATGLTKPTAHRIATTLTEMGFIERDEMRRGYVEGPRLLRLAMDTIRVAAPRNVRRTILRAVSEHTGETCNFGILTGSEVVYVDRVEAKWPLGLRFEAGSHVPAHCTAIGKLLLSRMSKGERQALINAIPLNRYTSRTLTDPAQLLEAIRRIGETQIGTDDQEFIDGVVCIAVPIVADTGATIGSLAISAPEARVSLDDLLKFTPIMRAAATELGATFHLRDADGA